MAHGIVISNDLPKPFEVLEVYFKRISDDYSDEQTHIEDIVVFALQQKKDDSR